MTYNPETGKWTSSSSSNSSTNKNSTNKSQNSSSTNKKTTSSTNKKTTSNINKKSSSKSSSNSGGNLSASNTNPKTSTGSAEKKYNTIEYNILEGSLTFTATKDTIKLNAGDTVKIDGIGKYLSGLYYVQDVTRNISENGYSHTATLIKTDFGNSVKSSSTTTQNPAKKNTSSSKTVSKSTSKKTYSIKKGDTLWSIAVKFYGDGNKYPKIAKENNISSSQYTSLPIGKKLIIP